MANYNDFFTASSLDYYTQYDHGGSLTGNFSVGFDKDPPPPDDTRSGALRFASVAIPQNTTVSNAELHIYATSRSGSGNLKIKVEGIKETNTADFSSGPSGRTRTTANNTNTFTQTGSGFYTINVTSIVNEIFAQGGWSSGNHIGFYVTDNGSDTGTDNFIIDTLSGLLPVLSILQSANPDFTPGPYSVRVNSSPPPQNYGIRISRPGRSADIASIRDLNFFGRTQVLKAIRDAQRGWPAASSLEKVSHQLKYAPAFLTYFKYNGKAFIAPRKNNYTADPVGGGVNVLPGTDSESVFMYLSQDSVNDPNSWYYYVFIDENL
jgi:hypothetical protein